MDRFRAMIQREVSAMLAQTPQMRHGIVRSVNGADATVRVEIQPEGVLSGWLPLGQAAAGNGWSTVTLPNIGDVAVVVPDAGRAGSGVVVGYTHNDLARPAAVPAAPGTGGTASADAAPWQAGETILAHKSGSVLRLCADGSIYSRGAWHHDGVLTVNGTVDAEMTITSKIDVVADRDVVATVDIIDRNRAHGSVATLRGAYDAHVHPVLNVQTGSGAVTTNLTDHPVP